MSFLDNLFGGGAKKKDADALYKRTTDLAGQNRAEQERILNPAYDQYRSTLGTGYNTAQSYYDQGRDQQLGSLGTWFDQARNDLGGGYDAALGRVGTGYDRARGELGAGFDDAIGTTRTYGQRAVDYLTPFINEGRTNERYTTLLGTGAGGEAAQATARGALNQNLINENREALDYEAKQRAAAANAGRTGLNSGRAGLIDARATTQAIAGLRGDELSRLESQAAREAGYASRAGDMTQRTGDTIADLQGRRGLGMSGLSTAQAGLEAGLESDRGRGYSALSADRGRITTDIYGRDATNRANLASNYYGDLGRSYTGQAGALAGAASDYYGNMAGAAQRQSDAYQSTRGTGMNNLAQWGGLALQGFTPGRMGTSAFGNIKNTLWGKGLS